MQCSFTLGIPLASLPCLMIISVMNMGIYVCHFLKSIRKTDGVERLSNRIMYTFYDVLLSFNSMCALHFMYASTIISLPVSFFLFVRSFLLTYAILDSFGGTLTRMQFHVITFLLSHYNFNQMIAFQVVIYVPSSNNFCKRLIFACAAIHSKFIFFRTLFHFNAF